MNAPGTSAEGGDPPCWAHLFDEEVEPVADRLDVVDVDEGADGAASVRPAGRDG